MCHYKQKVWIITLLFLCATASRFSRYYRRYNRNNRKTSSDEFKREVRKVDRWIESLQLLLDRQPPPNPPPWGGLEVSFRNPAFGPQLPEISSLVKVSSRLCNGPMERGETSDGVYDISIGIRTIKAYCEFRVNLDSFWMVFQRRLDGSLDFYKDWDEYVEGFGHPMGEHWLGLATLHEITRFGSYTLRVDLEDFEGNTTYAEYSSFAVGNASTLYPLSVGGYSGDAGDSLSYHNGLPFSTKDRDNDRHYRNRNCAVEGRGAWWYRSCQHSNLNGEYLPRGSRSINGIVWYHWKNDLSTLKRVSMKIKPNRLYV